MPGKYVIRTDEEWAELIRECRSSGLSDHMWCREKGKELCDRKKELPVP